MKIYWTILADLSFQEEIDFILRKWNLSEAEKFVDLVDDFITTLSGSPYLGKKSEKEDIRVFVLSKQTTVIYEVFDDLNRIDLLLFWNNKRDQNELKKLL